MMLWQNKILVVFGGVILDTHLVRECKKVFLAIHAEDRASEKLFFWNPLLTTLTGDCVVVVDAHGDVGVKGAVKNPENRVPKHFLLEPLQVFFVILRGFHKLKKDTPVMNVKQEVAKLRPNS
jgi:hypothetical protein